MEIGFVYFFVDGYKLFCFVIQINWNMVFQLTGKSTVAQAARIGKGEKT